MYIYMFIYIYAYTYIYMSIHIYLRTCMYSYINLNPPHLVSIFTGPLCGPWCAGAVLCKQAPVCVSN